LKARYFPDGLQSTLESSETSVSVEKQGLMGYCTEVTEVNTEVNSTEKTTKTNILPYKTEVTEVTEQTEGKKEKGTQQVFIRFIKQKICERVFIKKGWGYE